MNRLEQKPIVVMAGGTGGHVYPALAVAEILRQRGESIVWFGTRSGIEARVVPAAEFRIQWLQVRGLRGKGILTLMLAPYCLLRACWQALRLLHRIQPKAVLGMGGFVAGPGGLMAWLLRIPLFVHEQNSIVGLTNRILGRLAVRSFFAFPDAARGIPRSECIGNPVRASLLDLPPPQPRLQARLTQPLQLLVIGGSLGAVMLNRLLPAALTCLDREARPQVKHQCGDKHLQTCRQHYADQGVEVEVVGFIEDMQQAYLWADLVVCRAGAMTVAELTMVGLGSLLIPFPYAVDNHQYFNALYLQQHEAAQILREDEISAENLALKLQFFQQNRMALMQMAINARKLARPDASERLAQGILAGAGA